MYGLFKDGYENNRQVFKMQEILEKDPTLIKQIFR